MKKLIQLFMLVVIFLCAYLLPGVLAQKAMEASAVCAVTVAVDAGHGAADPGKVGVNGAKEKDINLSIALLVKEKLENEGIRAVLTRSDDTPLCSEYAQDKKLSEMQKRIRIIDESNAMLAVSIHQNSYSSEAVKGAQIFYFEGSENGKRLAEDIRKAMMEKMGPQNCRDIKSSSDYYILRHVKAPAVICECGFLSSWEDALKLVKEEYQEIVADAIVQGIKTYIFRLM